MRAVFIILFSLISFQALGKVEEHTLNNGLKIIVKEDHRAPVAVSMIWYDVGSADEPGGVSGVSHALEHLMFKGTLKYPLGVFSKTIYELGGQENAFTSYDYTAYFEKIPAANLSTSLELEADRMQNLLLEKNEFTKEMKVIQEERRLRTDDNPQALAFERFMSAAHLSTPYHHPVIGWMNDLKQMSVDDARAWYKQHYAPNNAAIVVVGDVNAAEVFALADKYFAHIPAQAKATRKQYTEPPFIGKKYAEVIAPAQVPVLMMGYAVPSVVTADKENAAAPYALEIIAGIIDAGENARFSKQLVRGKQIASSISASYNLYSRYETQFAIYGTSSQSHSLDELEREVIGELHLLQQELVSADELKRIKNQLIAQKIFELDSTFSQAMELGLLQTVGLGWKVSDTYVDRINDVTAEQVKQAAQRYFNDERLTITRLIPSKPDSLPRKN